MGEMGEFTGEILVFLGSVVVVAYILDMLAVHARIPGVLLVLGAGIATRSVADSVGFLHPPVDPFLPVLGTIGLILIVLEGAIELKISRDRWILILKSFLSALVVLLATLAAIGGLLHLFLGVAWRIALLNATPLAVISSAVAIPSVLRLAMAKREFVVYESSFSDILGVMIFTSLSAAALAPVPVPDLLSEAGVSLLATMAIAAVLSVVLFSMLIGIRHHVKSLLLLAVLLVAYGVAKMLHLPALLIVFLFGLLLANPRPILQAIRARGFRAAGRIRMEVRLFGIIVAEMTFLVRGFFFFMFGFSIDTAALTDVKTILMSLAIYMVILLVRLVYLGVFVRQHLVPEVFVAPRGLITILLFYSIPASLLIPEISRDVLFGVVLLSSVTMAFALRSVPPGVAEALAAPGRSVLLTGAEQHEDPGGRPVRSYLSGAPGPRDSEAP